MPSSFIACKRKFLEFQSTICFHSAEKLFRCTCKPCHPKKALEQLFLLHAFLLIVVSTTKSAQMLLGTGSSKARNDDVLRLGAKAHLSLLVRSAMLGCIQVASRHSTTSNFVQWTASVTELHPFQ